MDVQPDLQEDRRCRAAAAADIVALALERDLPHMALPAARDAARSALLVMAAEPHRLARHERDLLREMAAATPQHLAGRPAERMAQLRATLAVLRRLLAEAWPPTPGPLPEAHGERRRPRPGPHARAA